METKTREQIRNEVAALDKRFILLSMPTGLGKTYTALNATYKDASVSKVLIVYPKITIKDSWLQDIKKWGFEDKLHGITFTTYKSLEKYVSEKWDMILFDEGHHITERVMEIIQVMQYHRAMLLSATIKPSLRYRLQTLFPGLYTYKVSMQNAIANNILPDPHIVLMPLRFNMVDKTENIIKNPSATHSIVVPFEKRFTCNNKNVRYIIPCTEMQYYMDLDKQVDFYDRKFKATGSKAMHNLMLNKAGLRLKWLATKKTSFVKTILDRLKEERTLTFCASIGQTELVGENCIHSKNKSAEEVLKNFNEGKTNHITACAMLDEGVNLTSCRVGIFANINASERLQVQRIGRVLRHSDPIIIIPYYKGSREEEIVANMINGYNPELVSSVESINDLKI